MGLRTVLFQLAFCASLSCGGAPVWAEEFRTPWNDADVAIVLDPFHGNALDLDKVATDKRVAAIVHKASQGLGSDRKYNARRAAAKARGYLWGSYHLLTTADPIAQMDHYLGIVGAEPGEAHAIDIECLAATTTCQSEAFKVSVEDVEKAIARIKEKTGALPLLYVNDAVRKVLSARFAGKPELAGIRLWYARFKNDITGVFPDRHWQTYALWQFSSEINCQAEPGACPYRVPGTNSDMDLNVFNGTVEQLRAQWPMTQ
jgi:GH25 family lysozyme M1 (1,4-beta-N-acetylmuramidase)